MIPVNPTAFLVDGKGPPRRSESSYSSVSYNTDGSDIFNFRNSDSSFSSIGYGPRPQSPYSSGINMSREGHDLTDSDDDIMDLESGNGNYYGTGAKQAQLRRRKT